MCAARPDQVALAGQRGGDVTRIVAGAAKGRRLTVPARGTRPTSERAREALFNTLRAYLDLDGAAVLDLYAGSGAVGLEALSRGAARVVLVESDRNAAQALQRNVATVGLPGAQVVRRPVAAALGAAPEPFDFVFADPPYDLPDAEVAELLAVLAGGGWLAGSAVVVVERSARSPEPVWPAGIALITQRRYGDGQLWYGRANHG
jgi:16S rRNA (guanine966-N2)-methyltransferase